jgi:signal transduction histidine kinase
LGLGIIIHSIEVSCDGESKPPIVLGELSKGGRMKSYYDTYQTVPMSALMCQGDVLVKNWFNPRYKRYGYSNAPAAIGEASWIARIKELVEFFYTEVNVILSALFLMFYLAARSLKRLSFVDWVSSPFEPWSLYWLGFTLMMSDTVIDLFFPFSFGFWMWFVPRLGYFFGTTMTLGSLLTFFSGLTGLPSGLKKYCTILIQSRGRLFGASILVGMNFFIYISPLFSIGYRLTLAFVSLSSILVSLLEKNLMMLLFGLAVLSDYCKTLMVPYLPAPRLMIVYIGMILIYSIVKRIEVLETTAKSEGKSDLALQLAHDIRSPLNSLNMMLPVLNEISEDQRLIVRSAIGQIQEIANDLVINYKRNTMVYDAFQSYLMMTLLGQIIVEKRIQIGSKTLVAIENEIDPQYFDVFCKLNPVQLIRVISNIINNSIESFSNGSGTIKISLAATREQVFVTIADNGPGIPVHILNRLGEKGVSFGKTDSNAGSGLGVYYAKKVVEEWGGSLSIVTEMGRGTKVTLNLLRAKSPTWFTSVLQIPAHSHVIILDDDSSIHALWDKRFHEVGVEREKIHHFHRVDQLREKNMNPAFYLVDYHLSGSSKNGIEWIEALGIFKQSVLVTNRFDQSDLQEKCKKMGLKILPKSLVSTIPISRKK